jgi:hypothetical protein
MLCCYSFIWLFLNGDCILFFDIMRRMFVFNDDIWYDISYFGNIILIRSWGFQDILHHPGVRILLFTVGKSVCIKCRVLRDVDTTRGQYRRWGERSCYEDMVKIELRIACFLLSRKHVFKLTIIWKTSGFLCGPCSAGYHTNSVTLSPQANYTDWATATCQRNLVPAFAERGVSRGQSGGISAAGNLSFLDRSRYFFFHPAHVYPQEAEWVPFQIHCYSENLVAPGIEPGTSDSTAKNSDP